MEVKRGYKQTEVGVIPEDWEVKPIDKEIDLLTGFPFPSSSYSKTGIKLLRGSNIKRGVTDWSADITEYWEKLSPELKQYVLKEGDIVIAMDGSLVGRSFARLTHEDLPALLLQRVARVCSSKIDSGYLKEFICSDFFTKHCDSVKTVTAIPHISPKDIKEFQIPLPHTKAEQTAIAAALSDADALIQSLGKLIAKKRLIKQGAMQELLKPKAGWVVKKLGEIFTFHGGYTASREQLSVDGYCYLHYGDIHGATKTFINVKSDYAKIPKLQIPLKEVSPKSLLNEGDIVFVDASEDDEGTSRHIVVKNPDGVPYISGLHTIVAMSKDDSVNNDYKRYCFQSAYIKSQFKFYAVGTKVSGISKTNILKIEISLPKLDEQTRIATILADMDAEISTLETKLAKYKQVKQGMMQNLLTGKIRLV